MKVFLKGSLTINAIQIMDKGRAILEKHLDTFVHDGNLHQQR